MKCIWDSLVWKTIETQILGGVFIETKFEMLTSYEEKNLSRQFSSNYK
jgi:hypothetical protein